MTSLWFGSEHYTDVVVAEVTPRQTEIWDHGQARTLANNNFWGKTREIYGNPELFKLPAKVKLLDGTVLKSAQVRSFDQYGVVVWDGRKERRCSYSDLPAAIKDRYPFTDATRAEYAAAECLKFAAKAQLAVSARALQEQNAARERERLAREAAEAQARQQQEASEAAARRDKLAKVAMAAGAALLFGAVVKAFSGDGPATESDGDDGRAQDEKNRLNDQINRQNREREREDRERQEASDRQWREQKAREQQELMSRPRY